MSTPAEMAADLRAHFALCCEALGVVERESQLLRGADAPSLFEVYQVKKTLLPRLGDSLARLKAHRAAWQKLGPAERARHPEVPPLIRQNQDLIMKVIVLDRENEQALLRRGLLPARDLPPAQRQRPHFVADLYRKQGGA